MSERRGFFASFRSIATGLVKEDKPYYPLLPGFVADRASSCAECETSACRTSCGEEIVLIGAEGVPYMDFSRRGCTFCGDCAQVCPHDLFVTEPVERIDAYAQINLLGCLAWNKTICRSCADVCNEKVIQFTGLFNPEINADRCTGCGFCVGVCPGFAVTIRPRSNG